MKKILSVINPGAAKAKLSRYNFAGMGPWMLGKVAEDYKTPHPMSSWSSPARWAFA